MRSLAHLLRLLPLAAAALASVATSPMFSTLEIEAASPSPDESAVPADAVLTLRARVVEGEAPAGLKLLTRARYEVPGHSTERKDANGDHVYTFTPDAPLASDDYMLVFDGADGVPVANYADPDLDGVYRRYETEGESDAIVRFTTVSRPAVRYVVQPDAATFLVSFSEEMDLAALSAAVHLVDGAGQPLPATTSWRPEAHQLELQATPGSVPTAVRFDEGLVARTGVPVAHLPFTVASSAR